MRAEEPLTLGELEQCLRASGDLTEALFLAVFACTGAKLNEVLGMRIGDVWDPPPVIGGRTFTNMSALATRLSQHARIARIAIEQPGVALDDLKSKLLWLTPHGRAPFTRNSVAVMLGRISRRAGIDLTTTRFRVTRLAYLWHELKRSDPDALQRFAGLGTQFEILRRVEDAILSRPIALEDVYPGWEDALIERALPVTVSVAAQ